jgi:endonuclease-3
MATPNRSALIAKVLKVVRKHYKPVAPAKERTVLEHLLFACLVEDSPHDAAEQVFNALKQDYFGWNEVRVSTIRELTDALKPLVNPPESAARLKQTLHSVFESVYEFDIESLKKQNIGQAAKLLQKYNGTTPFAVAYVTQNALGGHAIPLNQGTLIALHAVRVISDAEFKQAVVPGLERTVPKNKGSEVGSLLHQLGVEIGKNPYGPAARKLMLEIDPSAKDNLPKRPTKPEPQPVKPAEPAPAAKAAAADGKKKAAAAAKEQPAKASEKEKEKKKDKAAKHPPAKPAPTKKPLKVTKKPTKKGAKKPTTRKLTKKKPR